MFVDLKNGGGGGGLNLQLVSVIPGACCSMFLTPQAAESLSAGTYPWVVKVSAKGAATACSQGLRFSGARRELGAMQREEGLLSQPFIPGP